MDAMKLNPEEDDEEQTLRNPRLAPKDEGLSKKRKIHIVVAVVAGLLLLLAMTFLMGGKKAGKRAGAIPAINRGLMQAENIRRQKDLFDDKSKQTDPGEEWVKKFQAMRQAERAAPRSDTMPDPVPLFTSAPAHDSAAVGGVKPTRTNEPFNSPWGSGQLPFRKPAPSSSPTTETEPAKVVVFKPSDQMAKQMTDEYQKALAYNASEQLVFTRSRTEDEGKGNGSSSKNPPSKSAGAVSSSGKFSVSAGQELTAVLNESLNSDYPSVAKATLTSPAELSGSTILLSYSLGQERVTAQVLKLILPVKEGERAKEQTLSAVVKSGLPGLAGDVSHHWIPQIASGIANAGLTAGALYYASQNSSKDLGTAVLVAPMIEQSVQGVLKPINYLGRDRPVTVSVPAGTEFTLLVTEGFEVDL